MPPALFQYALLAIGTQALGWPIKETKSARKDEKSSQKMNYNLKDENFTRENGYFAGLEG